jgi:mannose-6-phosphate isomerase-like protein (cupin superfamily)
MPFQTRIDEAARANAFFRRVLFTTSRSQLVLMSVEPGEDIGLETHHLDQVLFFVSGTGKAILDGQQSSVGPGDVVVVPEGTQHNFVNTGSEPLKLYTIYAPPEHAPDTVHRTRAEAMRAEAEEQGRGEAPAFTVGSLKETP